MWTQYVEAAQKLGFLNVSIVSRTTHQTLSSSSAETDTISNDECLQLLEDWGDIHKTVFSFFDSRFRILLRDEIDQKELERLKILLTFGFIKDHLKNEKEVGMIIPNEIIDIICGYVGYMKSYNRCKYIVGLGINNPNGIIVAYQFKTIWFIVYGERKVWRYRAHNDPTCFNGAQDAWNKASIKIFDFLDKSGL